MYFSTLSIHSWHQPNKSEIKISVPLTINITRKNRTKSFKFELYIRDNLSIPSKIFCTLKHNENYVLNLYECLHQSDRSICNKYAMDVVLQKALSINEWQLSASSNTVITDTFGANYLDMYEEEYFQYSCTNDIPPYKEMQNFRKIVDVLNFYYDHYKKKYSCPNRGNFHRLMFLDCKRCFMLFMDDDIDISFDVDLSTNRLQHLIYKTNFNLEDLKQIITGTENENKIIQEYSNSH